MISLFRVLYFFILNVKQMKLLFLILAGILAFPAFSQAVKKSANITTVRILSAEEAGKLERTNVETIAIRYAKNVNVEKEVTVKEYYKMLLKRLLKMQAKVSSKKMFKNVTEVYRQLSKQNPTQLMKLPLEISVFDCGGCGCATPDKAGYASCTGNSCWCACCPK